MIFTLQRYIFKELLKVFVLATVALTLMLSFGSILKPIQDYGVGPAAVIKLLGYFLPITLTFVLPISAVFSASLIYGRFAADNELDACKASGISLWTCIYPGMALAVCVSIATLSLSFYVVPNYVHRAERAIKADAKQILFRNIDRKGYYGIPGSHSKDFKVFADRVDSENNQLEGVIVAEVKKGEMGGLITARSANVFFEPKKQMNEVTIVAYDVTRFDSGRVAHSREFPIANQIGSMLADNIKFKEIDELHQIRSDIMRFYPVHRMATDSYLQLCGELLKNQIASKASPESVTQLQNTSTMIKFRAKHCKAEADQKLEMTDDVVIDEYSLKSGAKTYTYHCPRAVMQVSTDEDGNVLIEMIAFDARWSRPDGTTGIAQQSVFQNLQLPDSVKSQLKASVLATVMDMPSIILNPTGTLNAMAQQLSAKIGRTYAEINAEINSRLVLGIGCIALILIGSGLGIMLKGGHLLTAFGASSVPAAILIICMMMGKNMATNKSVASSMSGLALMWSGLAVLIILNFLIYRKLLKN